MKNIFQRPVIIVLTVCISVWAKSPQAMAQGPRGRETYRAIKEALNRVPAIDTHDHLQPFEKLPGFNETRQGKGMNLAGIWRNSYYTWYNPLTPWEKGMEFDAWWSKAKHDFKNARSTSFYRYQLPAFEHLYGVDFDQITDVEARELDRKIFENYKDQKWLYEVITEKANIELMFNDPYWARLEFKTYYPWEVLVFNVTSLVRGFHASEYSQPADSPYVFAEKHGLAIETFDDYLKVLDHLFLTAKDNHAVCLKTTLAYQRTLHFENVPRERAEKAFGKRASALTPVEIKDFEDYTIWRICELSAKYELPFQIHTGQARIQGSNPMLLVDMIEANRKTKFILFHGGYPWVGETAVIAQKNKNVWIDSVWLPMLSYSMGKRALHEWLDSFPSNRIMWGADCNHAEGIYGATEFTRRWIAEVLAEKVENNELTMEHAHLIGRQILRENALELFPQLQSRLWKESGKKMEPAK